MSHICPTCDAWMTPEVNRAAKTMTCPACGGVEGYETFPLFILTGASGTGKTAILPYLRPLLPDFAVFETDTLWDSGGDWDFVWQNWLRVAHSLALSGRPTLLCGTVTPERIDRCDFRPYFDPIHYLALHCDDATRAARLRSRPAWRNCDASFIVAQQNFAHWLLENAENAFSPPITVFDATHATPDQTAQQIREWVLGVGC